MEGIKIKEPYEYFNVKNEKEFEKIESKIWGLIGYCKKWHYERKAKGLFYYELDINKTNISIYALISFDKNLKFKGAVYFVYPKDSKLVKEIFS